MFELEAGRADVAADILDESVLPHAHASAQDAADGTALLWRLERAGFVAGSRWRLLSDAWLARGGFGFWPYLDLHAAVAFHAAHDEPRAAALDAAVIARTRRRDLISRRAREVTLAGLRGIRGFATGAFDAAKQRVGRERVHLAHWAQPDRAEALQARLECRPKLEAVGRRSPSQLREGVELGVRERAAGEDVFAGVGFGEAIASGRERLAVAGDDRADAETPGAKRLPCKLDRAMHGRRKRGGHGGASYGDDEARR